MAEHRQDYPSQTAGAEAVAKQLGLGRERSAAGCCRPTSMEGRPGVTSAEHAEIKRLKAENRRLQEDRYPARGHNFCAGELDSRSR